jgi:hypothetical protein
MAGVKMLLPSPLMSPPSSYLPPTKRTLLTVRNPHTSLRKSTWRASGPENQIPPPQKRPRPRRPKSSREVTNPSEKSTSPPSEHKQKQQKITNNANPKLHPPHKSKNSTPVNQPTLERRATRPSHSPNQNPLSPPRASKLNLLNQLHRDLLPEHHGLGRGVEAQLRPCPFPPRGKVKLSVGQARISLPTQAAKRPLNSGPKGRPGNAVSQPRSNTSSPTFPPRPRFPLSRDAKKVPHQEGTSRIRVM